MRLHEGNRKVWRAMSHIVIQSVCTEYELHTMKQLGMCLPQYVRARQAIQIGMIQCQRVFAFEFERFKCISQSAEQSECSMVRHPKSGTTAKFKVLGTFESKVLDGSAPISGDRRRSHAHDAKPFLAFLSVLVTRI